MPATRTHAPARRQARTARGIRWKRLRVRLPLGICLLALAILAAISLLPLYWMTTGSLKLQSAMMQVPPDMIPLQPTLANWHNLLTSPKITIWRWLANSVLIAGAAVLVSVSLSALMGYTFAKKRFLGRTVLFWLILATMMLPQQVIMVPLYLGVRSLKLYSTYVGMVIPALVSPFGVFLMRQFMSTLPDELFDSARIDGASEWSLFASIALPLSWPAMAALSIFTFFNTWNNFMWQLIMAKNATMFTLPVGVSMMAVSSLGERAMLDYGLLMAGGTFAAIPMVLFFLAFQKYFIQGITMGAVKG